MKKALLVVPLIAFAAAGCSATKPTVKTPAQDSAKPEVTQEDKKPEVGSWKTYKSAKYGFEISYPSSYTVTENPKDAPYKGAAVLLTNQDAYAAKTDKVYGRVSVKAVRGSLKAENNTLFNWTLVSQSRVNGTDVTRSYFMYDYFTASASDASRVYVLTNTTQKSPADDGSGVGSLLIANVEAGTEGEIGKTTTPDWIARTLRFAK